MGGTVEYFSARISAPPLSNCFRRFWMQLVASYSNTSTSLCSLRRNQTLNSLNILTLSSHYPSVCDRRFLGDNSSCKKKKHHGCSLHSSTVDHRHGVRLTGSYPRTTSALTSAKEVVSPGVCLFVCLLATSRKNY